MLMPHSSSRNALLIRNVLLVQTASILRNEERMSENEIVYRMITDHCSHMCALNGPAVSLAGMLRSSTKMRQRFPKGGP